MSKDPGPAASTRAAHALAPVRPGSPRPGPGLIVLGLGGACLLAGLDAALLRLGARVPVGGAALAALYAPVMLVGFLGAVIALERAVAVGEAWALLAPAGGASGCLALVAGVPEPAGQVLAFLGALVLCAIYVRLHRRAASISVDIGAMGAIALTGGDLLWLRGAAVEACVPLWLLFPVLALVGARLEPAPDSSGAVPGTLVQEAVRAVSAAALLGACLLGVTGGARLLIGLALLALAAVMIRDDAARRAVRATGAARLAAAWALAGHLWLAVAGLVWSLGPLDAASGAGSGTYDILVRAIVLGYALSMIMARLVARVEARSPTTALAAHRGLPHRRTMWPSWALLHAGLALWAVSQARGASALQRAGGVISVVAVLVLMLLALAAAAGWLAAGRAAEPGAGPAAARRS